MHDNEPGEMRNGNGRAREEFPRRFGRIAVEERFLRICRVRRVEYA